MSKTQQILQFLQEIQDRSLYVKNDAPAIFSKEDVKHIIKLAKQKSKKSTKVKQNLSKSHL